MGRPGQIGLQTAALGALSQSPRTSGRVRTDVVAALAAGSSDALTTAIGVEQPRRSRPQQRPQA